MRKKTKKRLLARSPDPKGKGGRIADSAAPTVTNTKQAKAKAGASTTHESNADPRVAQAFDLTNEADRVFLARVKEIRTAQRAGKIPKQAEAHILDKFQRRMDAWTARKVFSTLTHEEFLEVTKISRPTLQLWKTTRGLSVVQTENGYSLFAYLDWVREQVAGRRGRLAETEEGEGAESLDAVTLRIKRAQADRNEVELATMKGELQAEFERLLEKVLVRIVAARVAMPKQVALRLANKTPQEVETELTAFNRAYIEELRQAHSGLPDNLEAKITQILEGPP